MEMLVIMSHDLNKDQIKEAKDKLNVETIKTMPERLKSIWKNIPPKGSLPIENINKIVEWIDKKSEKGDYVLVQGDFGSTYYVVDYCFISGRVPIYATSYRVIQEKQENGITLTSRVFKHESFRTYLSYK